MENVLAQQTTIDNKLHATELLWESESKGKDSTQTSNEEAREVLKPFGPRAKLNEKANTVRSTMFRTMLPTTDLDGSDVDLFYFFDSPEHARVFMATPKKGQHEDISISADENVS